MKAMEAAKTLEVQPRGTPRRIGRGTFRRWRRELGRPSPAEAGSGARRPALPYNRCGAGKWAGCREGVGGGRSTGRTAGQHNLRGGKGRCFVHAQAERPGSVSAGFRLGPPWRLSEGTGSARCSMCFTGRPRPTRDRRFHALQDKVYREDVLWRAWVAVRRNNGAPGIDKTTLADVEEYGVTRLLGELASELREGRGGRCLRGRC